MSERRRGANELLTESCFDSGSTDRILNSRDLRVRRHHQEFSGVTLPPGFVVSNSERTVGAHCSLLRLTPVARRVVTHP